MKYHVQLLILPDTSNQSVPKIPVAPPPNIANPDKEVSVCTAADVCVYVLMLGTQSNTSG